MSESTQKKDDVSAVLDKDTADGGVYLLVADDTPELEAALRRVDFLARQNNAHVAFLYVMDDEGYLHWKVIEKRIEGDKRAEAERKLWDLGQRLYEKSGLIPGFYIKEGKRYDEIMELVNTDPSIRTLVLGAAASSSNPLISYFTGKGLSELRVPLLIVPEGH